jgi:putative ABC transport system substrate-binding protein
MAAIDNGRRKLIAALGGVAVAWPLAARGQQPMKPVIGFLNTQSSVGTANLVTAFRKGLSQTDFAEGNDFTIEYRWAEGQYDRLPSLAADLLNHKVSVIVAAYVPAVLAARALTSTIPIVFISGLDPVTSGLVVSLNRPGGNLTGISNYNVALVAKRIELVHQMAPQAGAIALLVNPTTATSQSMAAEGDRAAKMLGLRLRVLRAGTESDIDSAFVVLVKESVGALVVAGDSFLFSRFEQIASLAAHYKIPTMYDRREDAVSGGLISYGTNVADLYRQAGVYTGKILKGAKPADLPVEEATKVELVVNLKTVRTLGLDMPTSILLRADEVIE